MNVDDYEQYIEHVQQWAVEEPDVISLVAVGSTAGLHRLPDRYSDHDLLVVTQPGAANRLLDDLGWLPVPARIAFVHRDTDNGRGVVYDDGISSRSPCSTPTSSNGYP